MKTEEELNALKEEVETLKRKLRELNEEELEQVTGGDALDSKGKTQSNNVAIFPGLSGFP